MFGIITRNCIFIYATLLAAHCVLGQHLFRKPWPTYSLQNMPQTQFTCHDKILGGYYADAETQCQMFHVCVKVSGVGVQDFRFLCPNATAFDQEAQICADWGDVDCNQSVLYYGSDNFDLYRIGSGFESKRAPLAEEEEATFHLQRAESADIRRSKETRVDQKLRPDQPPNYVKRFEETTRNTYSNSNSNNNNNNNNYGNSDVQQQQQKQQQQRKKQRFNNNNSNNNFFSNNKNYNVDDDVNRVTPLLPEAVTKKPIVNYYTPSTPATTTTTTTTHKTTSSTTTTTERYNDESKQEFDDIFKGSHSSHYFANRNGGREDDFIDHPTRIKPNDITDYNKKTQSTTTTGKSRTQPTRSRRIQQKQHQTTTTTTTTAAPATKISKKLTLQTSFHTEFQGPFKASTQATTTANSIPITPSTRPSYANSNRFNLNAHDYQTQEKIQPTTYNPGNSIYRIKTTAPPKFTDFSRDSSTAVTKQHKISFHNAQYDAPNRGTVKQLRNKVEKLERTSAQNSTFVNHKEFTEFAKIKTQQPQPFQPAQVFRPPSLSKALETTRTSNNQTEIRARNQNQEPQFHRTRSQVKVPAPAQEDSTQFNQRRGKPKDLTTTLSPDVQPRGFTSRGSINYKATTQRNNGENYNTPTTLSAAKKFSTLVPKDQYYPTTYKPTTYKKAYENSYFLTQQTARPIVKSQQKFQTTTTTTILPTTVDPYYNPDEDDGQYHPELYEQEFPKTRLNLQRSTTTTTTTTTAKPNNNFQYPQSHLKTQQQTFFQKQLQQQQQQTTSTDLSDEDEIFNTAHSLNFGAASVNKLRADILKAEKTSQQYNAQYALNLPQQSSSPKTGAPTYLPSSSTTSYTTAASTSTFATSTLAPFVPTTTRVTTTTTTTTARPTPQIITQPTFIPVKNPKVSHKSTKSKSNKSKKSSQKSSSKRPPHADEDTSYDYAYYDTDSLSETPQEYQDYEIAEFTRTRKN